MYNVSVFYRMLIFIFAANIIAAASAQTAMPFDNGLLLHLPGFESAGVSMDAVEKMLVLGQWRTPLPGDEVRFVRQTAQWKRITADKDGWFVDDKIRGGYVFCTLQAKEAGVMLLEENGPDLVYVNGELRIGNRYGYKAQYNAWEPKFDFVLLPVEVKRGSNNFLFFNSRTGRLKARLLKPQSAALLNVKDATLPDFLTNESVDHWGAVVVINASKAPLRSYRLTSQIGDQAPTGIDIPVIRPLSVRKVAFRLHGATFQHAGEANVRLILSNDKGVCIDSAEINIAVKEPRDVHKRTFISKIDGSVQYFAVNPAQAGDPAEGKALVLSVHGASVEALNQAASYHGKKWANIVSPTNRRPYGFDWEDWGRDDAMEVLDIAQQRYNADPSRIYLTGHSMGGHGAWHLGALFPDRFAAIAPSAGWISFWSYAIREKSGAVSPVQQMLLRSLALGRTMDLAENYKQLGVYILHGGADDVVPPQQSRTMVEHLQKFHKDFVYHEEPGQGHWWDLSDEPGADCVDWPPLFDFLARHARPGKERIRRIRFITANPGVSAVNNWVAVEAQIEPLKASKIDIRVDPGMGRFIGSTHNISLLSLDLSVLDNEGPTTVQLDGQRIENIPRQSDRIWLAREQGKWRVAGRPPLSHKGPHRYGPFKEAFKNRFIFVYGTGGDAAENRWAFEKARYDAEYFWYQGNGSVDVVPDHEFDPMADVDRSVILYGSSDTNGAWAPLLSNSPVQVYNGRIVVGEKTINGRDFGCLFIRPRPGSDVAMVGVVSGSGLVGMRLLLRRPYMQPGHGYPDLTILTPKIFDAADDGFVAAGFFGNDWSLRNGDFRWCNEQ